MVKKNEFIGVDEKFMPEERDTEAKKAGSYSEPILGEKGRKRLVAGRLVLLIVTAILEIAILVVAIVNIIRGFNSQNEMIKFQEDTYNQMLESIKNASK